MGKVVHFEIPVDDPERAGGFYRETLGWEITGWGGIPYWVVEAGPEDEPGANGALIAREDFHRSPIVIVAVDDLESTLAATTEHGGRVLQGRLPVPGVGWSAYIEDTEGNVVGLLQPDPDADPGAVPT